MPPSFVSDGRLSGGLTPDAYLDVMAARAEAEPDPDDAVAAERAEFTKLNLQRTLLRLRNWQPSPELAALAAQLDGPQTWMVLTEPWCGDSAQCLPSLAVLSAGLDQVELRFLLRDDNLDIMDQYLTDGKRSIPLLVAFDAAGEEIFRWGPRTTAAQAVVDEARTEGLDKSAWLERLNHWYGKDRCRSLDAELVAVLRGHLEAQ